MGWLTNEALFYGGGGGLVCSLVLGIVYYAFSYIRKVRLNIQLDEEYGKEL